MDHDFYQRNYWAEEHHWWYLGRRRILLRLLDGWVPPVNGGRERQVLDVGCGTGGMLSHLGRYGDAFGVDMHEQAVRFCHTRGLEHVQLVDDPPYPFADEQFDLVTVLDVIEHVDDDVAVLKEISRVLRPDGILLVTVPAYMSLWGGEDVISHHRRRYRSGQLRERMIAADLEVQRLSYFNTLFFPAVAGIRLARRLSANSDTRVDSDSDVSVPNAVNEVLTRLFAAEAPLIERMNLPFGVSILGLATKRPE